MKSRRGDTLVEIMFAVGIFGLVAIGAIGIMNRGLYDAQKALEITMARQEIDAQAEAIRFIHAAYIAEKTLSTNNYANTWDALTKSQYVYNSPAPNRDVPDEFYSAYTADKSCNEIYGSDAFPSEAFIVNTRRLDADIINTSCNGGRGAFGYCVLIHQSSPPVQPLETTPVYPRILYGSSVWSRTYDDTDSDLSDNTVENNSVSSYASLRNVQKAQGIWVTTIASDKASEPEYYDFHIRTCWHAPGSTSSTTISTIVRLFNPDYAGH